VPALLQYLSDQKPAAGLAPAAGTMERYRMLEWLNFVTAELHKTFGPMFRPTTPEEFKKLSLELIGRRFEWLDKEFAGKQYSDRRQIHPSRRLPVRDVAVGDRARHGFEQMAEPGGLRGAGRSAAESAASTQGRRLAITASR
jgi:hypothetical protein